METEDQGFGSREPAVSYLSIRDGQIAAPAKEGDEGAVSHTIEKGKNKGKVVWYKLYPSYTGILRRAFLKKNPFTDGLNNLVLRFSKVQLEFPVDGSHARSFILKARNISLGDQLTIRPYQIAREDDPEKYNTGLSLYQGGEKIENFLDPKEDLPALVKLKKPINGRKYDSTDLVEYLENHIKEWINDNELSNPSSLPNSSKEQKDDSDDEEQDDSQSTEEEEDTAPIPF